MKGKLHFFFIAFCFLISSCSKSDPTPSTPDLPQSKSSEKRILKFVFTKADNPSLFTDVEGTIVGNTISVNIYNASKTSLKPTITFSANSINSNNTVVDFTNPVTYTVTADDGTTANYIVTVTVRDVYVVGHDYDNVKLKYKAVYWKNGVKTELTDGSTNAHGYGIALIGSDVYVAGSVDLSNGKSSAVYWKNGVKTVLSDNPATSAAVHHLITSGNDIYVVGSIDNKVVYWKNGTQVDVTDGSSYAFGDAMFINGTDVYVLGQVNTLPVAAYWKNGTKNIVTSSSESEVISMCLSGTDTYMVGVDNGTASYWKNGTKNPIVKGTAWSTYADGTNVHIVGNDNSGSKNIGFYWKNGVKTSISDGSTDVVPLSVMAIGNDTYIAGTETKNGIAQASFWLNGQMVTLSTSKSLARFVYVK